MANFFNQFSLYGNAMGGIFFDEGWNTCGDNNQYADLYPFISDTTKSRHAGAYTVLNPGGSMPQCFKNRSVILDGEFRQED